MSTIAPSELAERLARHGQEHLLRWWDELSPEERAGLHDELEAIDFARVEELVETLVRHDPTSDPARDRIGPVAVTRLPRTDDERSAWAHAAELGRAALRAGEVAAVVVAGGQGTRLGFDGPKGVYPIGPVSGKSLFQLHAEKLVALGRRFQSAIPLYVMTSPANHDATAAYWDENDRFGLDRVRLFMQGQMPAVDRATGKVLLADKGRVALSPDGHGGVLAALAAPGANGAPSCLEEMRARGVTTLFYFQVDNPLVRIADPAFLGIHRSSGADVSFKVVEKRAPDEKVGLVVSVDGRAEVIEYSDLPLELAERRDEHGRLELWAGSIATHVFRREFVERLLARGADLPYHRAVKKVAYVDDEGRIVEPAEPNAVKFEKFVFDALPRARRYAIVEADREREFEPLKNATGSESPATVRARLSELYAEWVEQAGATVPRRPDGSLVFPIEISPLYALDADELRANLQPGLVVERPLLLN